MRLSSEFIRLPLQFDVERLLHEAHQFTEYDWDYHPLGYQGNTALSLVSSGGDATNTTSGAMLPTAALERAPYIQQIMAELKTVVGRSRFMRLAPNSVVPPHSDTDYAWRNRVRIHIPIITDPRIVFSSIASGDPAEGDQKRIDVHMRAGEAWIFDNWREHTVSNPTDVRRIHLVIDTVGTSEFWNLAEAGWKPGGADQELSKWQASLSTLAYSESAKPAVPFENFNSTPVRSPDEIETMMREFMSEISHLNNKAPANYQDIQTAVTGFCQDWRGHWSLYWCLPDNIPHYQKLVDSLKAGLQPKLLNVALQSNRVAAYSVIANWLDQTTDSKAQLMSANTNRVSESETKAPKYQQPVFIVSAPRSGSTMLFEALKTNKLLWTLGDEIDREIEAITGLHPETKGYESSALGAEDASPEITQQLQEAFATKLRNASGIAYHDMPPAQQADSVRLIEKTLNNALRIPFLKAVFPDAKFILVYRDEKASIASMIEAWESGAFVSYPDLAWSLPLIEGWRDKINSSSAEIAAIQWASIVEVLVNDLSGVETLCVSYESLLNETSSSLQRVCEFCEVPFGPKMQQYAQTGFPLSKFTLSEPSENKWAAYQSALSAHAELYQAAADKLKRFVNA